MDLKNVAKNLDVIKENTQELREKEEKQTLQIRALKAESENQDLINQLNQLMERQEQEAKETFTIEEESRAAKEVKEVGDLSYRKIKNVLENLNLKDPERCRAEIMICHELVNLVGRYCATRTMTEKLTKVKFPVREVPR